MDVFGCRNDKQKAVETSHHKKEDNNERAGRQHPAIDKPNVYRQRDRKTKLH